MSEMKDRLRPVCTERYVWDHFRCFRKPLTLAPTRTQISFAIYRGWRYSAHEIPTIEVNEPVPLIYDEELEAMPHCQKWLNEVHHDSPDYVYKREHKIANGKRWATRTPSSVYGTHSGAIEIPVSELNGMSPQAIGNAVLSLRDEAHITDLLDRTEKWFRHWRGRFYESTSSGGFKRLLVQFCMQLGGCYWYGPWRHDSEWLKQILQEMQSLQHAPEIREAYLALTEFIDAASERRT